MYKYLAPAALMLSSTVFGADWNQYRGPNHDGSSDDKISTSWAAKKPKELWRTPMGEGFGTCAANAKGVFCVALREGKDVCVALNPATGKEMWATPIARSILNEKQGGDGPRSTPALDGDRVYVLGTWLRLVCLDAATGKEVWAHDLDKEFGGTYQIQNAGINNWGSAESPVIDGNLVFVHGGGAGQAFLAFNKTDGKLVWKAGDDKLTHCTATVATIHGVRQVIFFTKKGLAAFKTETGEELWRFPYKWAVSTAISPVASGDIVYLSAGYSVGGGACQVVNNGGKFEAKELWQTPAKNVNHWSTPVIKDGHVYGHFGFKEYHEEPLKCIELKTGKEIWSQKGFGQGGTILVGEQLLTLGEDGQLVLSEASPKGYKELGRINPVTYKCWNNPIVAGGKIYARSTKEIVCVDASN